MKTAVRILITVSIALFLMACSLMNVKVELDTETQPSETPAERLSSPLPPTDTPAPAMDLPPEILDPCSLVTTAEGDGILGEPAGAPKAMGGGCTFNNAKDSLYAVSVGAAQDEEAGGILQGQAFLLGMAGASLDEARMANLKKMSEALDYQGFFSELTAAAKDVPAISARLIEDETNDLVYWAWITAQTRRQGAYIAVRDGTLVNVNLVVADAQTEESMLAASASLAGKIFERLPANFILPVPAAQPTPSLQPAPTDLPTMIPTPTWVGLAAPALVSPQDGAVMDQYPRDLTLQWVPIPQAIKYVVEVEACSNNNPSDCFSLIHSETTNSSFYVNFVGAQPGRWRVWAVDGNGIAGSMSNWWQFRYTR